MIVLYLLGVSAQPGQLLTMPDGATYSVSAVLASGVGWTKLQVDPVGGGVLDLSDSANSDLIPLR